MGHGDLSGDLIHEVSEDGFVTLRPLRDHKTPGAWLEVEIEGEVDRRTASELIVELERVLAIGTKKPTRIDGWLIDEFFRRHLSRTNGEPSYSQYPPRMLSRRANWSERPNNHKPRLNTTTLNKLRTITAVPNGMKKVPGSSIRTARAELMT